MTERLAALLHDEADQLDVPTAPAAATLAAGHRARRQRRAARWAGVAGSVAAVVALAAGAVAISGDSPETPRPDGLVADPAPAGAADVGAVFAVGDTVYLDGGALRATMDETVQAMYLTSAGVVVRTNKTGASDGGAPFHFSLVAPDGSTSDLGLTLGEVVPATDPTEPYLAYASMDGYAIQAVVVDVTTGEEVARVDVPGSSFTLGYEAPPVALSGDTVFVGTDDGAQIVDWRTGTTTPSDVMTDAGLPDVAGGHIVKNFGDPLSVLDVTTGDTLLTVKAPDLSYMSLSLDGRYAKVVDQSRESGFDVYSVTGGSRAQFDGPAQDYGWTSDGDLFTVSDDGLELCDPSTGDCELQTLPGDISVTRNTFVRVLGMTYES